MPVPRTSHEERPRRLVLRPGARVVRRDDEHLQVGLDPPRRVILRATAAARVVLGALADPLGLLLEPSPDTDAARDEVLRVLDSASLLVDAVDVERHGRLLDPGVARTAYALHGWSAVHRLDARLGQTVAVHADGVDASLLIELLQRAGVGVVTGAVATTARLQVALSAGPVARTALDEWMARGEPHLVVADDQGVPSLGPFVEPGVTACQRCIDAHRSTHDPRRPLLMEQLSTLPPAVSPDPVLDTLTQAWAARDVVTYLEGGRPSTWSAIIVLGADEGPTTSSWQRHPACGCAWDALTRVG